MALRSRLPRTPMASLTAMVLTCAGCGSSGKGTASGGSSSAAGSGGASGTASASSSSSASSASSSSSSSGVEGTGGSYPNPVVTVEAGTVLHTIPRDIYGINMAAWTGLVNSGEATYEERMKVAGVTQVRWPGGSWADILDWNDIQCQSQYDSTT